MKPIHLGFLYALLLGGSELTAKGGFRKIYDEEKDPTSQHTRCIKYLQDKMVKHHGLNDANGEEGAYQWDLYFFKQFAKLYLVNPKTIEEATSLEAQYRAFRATTMFMLRTAKPMWGANNGAFLTDLATKMAALRGIANAGGAEFQLTTNHVETWINNLRNGATTQVQKGTESRAKTSIIMAWSVWVKKPEAPIASRLKLPEQPGSDGVNWIDDADWDSPRGKGQEQ